MTTFRGPASLFCVALVLGIAASGRAQFLSPGELARPHAGLEGDDRCGDCHSSGRRVDNGQCTGCHDDIGGQLSARRGLHGAKYAGKACSSCHVEHRGAGHALIRWPGGSPQGFDHAETRWPLKGSHREAKCADCHKQRNKRGASSFLGARKDCASCHEDPHEKRLGKRCLDCHNETQWKQVRLERFDHALARFELVGKHEKVECAKCHREPPKYRGLEFKSCKSCHEDPHAGRFSERCSSCHEESGWKDLHMARAAHPGLSLAGGHRKVACASCHDAGLTSSPTRGRRCASCHATVHEAPFGNDCASCHRGIRWFGVKPRLSLPAHERTAFPLVGRHAKVECRACHPTELAPAQRYRELSFARCDDCHKDAHDGRFASRDGGECAPCHDEHGFRPTRFTVEQHATTDFTLLGKHVAVPCKGCHQQAAPRLDWHLDADQCVQCHDNPHREQFAREMAQGGCATCHSPRAWNEPNIDHSSWPLEGAHSLAQCGQCHDPSAEDRRAGQGASYRGVPRSCEGCHEDVHLGQFRTSAPERGCEFCHQTASFKIGTFEHAGLAGYPLEGKHDRVACEGCHHAETLRNGEQAIRYRLTYSNCADCHADPHQGEAP